MAFRRIRLKLFLFISVLLFICCLIQFYFANPKFHYGGLNSKIPQGHKKKSLSKQLDANGRLRNSEALMLNFDQKVYNTDKFGKHSTESIIIVVQVRNEIDHFRKVLESLENVKDISQVTLVVSLSDNRNETNDLVARINFCRYIKIVFPFSMDFFPDSFPGQDSNDCSRDIPKHEAIKSNCNNAYYPDTYGHYREVKFVQLKHHWLWKLNMIYYGIRIFHDLQQPVAMLEGNHYVLPDFLLCLKKAYALTKEKCSNCGVINLGNSATSQSYEVNNRVEIFPWASSKSGVDFVLTPDFYRQLIETTDAMCEFDDYNWLLSLQHVLSTVLKEKSSVVQFKSSRVFRLGTCQGMSTRSCSLNDEVKFIEDLFKNQPLFPNDLQTSNQQNTNTNVRPNGGWGDLRDQTLCKQYKSLAKTLLLT